MNRKKQNILLLTIAILYNLFVFYGSRIFERGRLHHDLTIALDGAIPLLPWTILIYYAAFLFWAALYYLCITYDKSGGRRFLIAHFLGETVCLLVFVCYPTTMARPEITGTTIFDRLMTFTYSVDTPDNLLPSIHCFVSWLCWIGTRNNPHFPRRYQYLTLFAAIAICFSTLTVKQHVIVDAAAGIALAELSYLLAGPVGRLFRRKAVGN